MQTAQYSEWIVTVDETKPKRNETNETMHWHAKISEIIRTCIRHEKRELFLRIGKKEKKQKKKRWLNRPAPT